MEQHRSDFQSSLVYGTILALIYVFVGVTGPVSHGVVLVISGGGVAMILHEKL